MKVHYPILFLGILLIFFSYTFVGPSSVICVQNNMIITENLKPSIVAHTRAENNTDPLMTELWVFIENNEIVFEINYTDIDGDEGTVLLYIDDNTPKEMRTTDFKPREGQYYYLYMPESQIDDYTEFYITAEDNNGSLITVKAEFNKPYLVGDFVGWGEVPVLSSPDVYFDGDDWVFNVTYWDPDGDDAESVWLNIVGQDSISMNTKDPDPLIGQNFIAHVIESKVDTTSEFYISTMDVNGSYAYAYDKNSDNLVVSDFISDDDPGNGDNDDDGDSSSSGFALPKEWTHPEVIVGIIALIGMAVGSGIGIWLRKKKRKRFSELLSKIDDVYGSYKMHPRRCERELEKIKSEVETDLKSSVIDENNYSILKERINEIIQEIRSESVRSKIGDLPKDIELRIKDMLIDGKISRKEYNKFMLALKGSDMASKDKKQMEKLIDKWLKEDKDK
jgi:hypothetical protein